MSTTFSTEDTMFRKRFPWYRIMLKALLFSGIIYKFAKMFMKSADKLAGYGKKKRKKK
jgi:hypothetical protein